MKRRNSESLTDVLRGYLREEGLETPLNQYRIIDSWKEVLGAGVARYTGNMFIKNQTLFVKITSPVLKNDLMMARTRLVTQLNEQVGAYVISDIVFL